jgi:hypothetical protein
MQYYECYFIKGDCVGGKFVTSPEIHTEFFVRKLRVGNHLEDIGVTGGK